MSCNLTCTSPASCCQGTAATEGCTCLPMTVMGLVPTVYTPLDDKGKLNLSVIPDYAEYLHSNQINGIVLAGTSGEGPALTLNERKELLYAWVKETKPRGLKVVMQVGGQPFPDVLEIAAYSESVGADALLSLPEIYYKPPTDLILVNYLKMVSKAAPTLPILYYHHPAMSGVTINAAEFFREASAALPNFKGMKCDFISALEITASGLLQKDQQLFMISHLTMASNVLMGINNSMSVEINIYPKLYTKIQNALANGNLEKARQFQLELNERIAAITTALGEYVPYSKAAMEFLSEVRVGDTRDPLGHVSREQRRLLEERLQDMEAKFASKY